MRGISQSTRCHRRPPASLVTALAVLLTAGALAGCAGRTGPAAPDGSLTVWSLENLPPRMAATEKVVDRFEERTGIRVELVGVAEAQLPQLVMAGAASGTLPDVIGAVPMGPIWQMYSNGLLNTGASSRVVRSLGTGTFEANALRLTSDGATRLAVPSDASPRASTWGPPPRRLWCWQWCCRGCSGCTSRSPARRGSVRGEAGA